MLITKQAETIGIKENQIEDKKSLCKLFTVEAIDRLEIFLHRYFQLI